MNEHEYTVGETVYIIEFSGKPSHRTKVTEVRDLKRGPKVTCDDGTVWDVSVYRRWGSRSDSYYTGAHLEPTSDKRETEYRALVSKSFVNWALHNFDELTVEQQDSIRNVIVQVKRERKNSFKCDNCGNRFPKEEAQTVPAHFPFTAKEWQCCSLCAEHIKRTGKAGLPKERA